ncbi:MAG: nitronate monooxygenase [Chloroflexi bacterium]|nr:nitronate monooxygenase [Chloroflexota bacterium]
MNRLLHTPICDKLGIEYPVFLAGMGGVSLSKLVAAVSNAGGLGIMGAATLSPEQVRDEIRKTKELTDKPFAVDLLAPDPNMIRPHMKVVFEEGVRIFVAGLAVPAEFIEEMHKLDMIVMVMCGKVRHAQKSADAGADIVAAQGTEAGGHTGEIGGMALVPQVVDAVDIPVIAAGGLADGRGLVAALALGAQGAIFGTRLIATPEAQAAPGYQEAILRANDADTLRTRCYTGKTARTIRNAYTDDWENRQDELQPFPMQAMVSVQEKVMDYPGVTDPFDVNRTFMPAGQGAGLIKEMKPAGEVIRDIIREAEEVIQNTFVAKALEPQPQ